MLIEMNGICQYVLFNLMTSDGIKGYGYKNVINTNLVYRIGERIESKSQIFLGTDIYSCLEKTFAETAWEKLCEKVNLKKFVPNDIDELCNLRRAAATGAFASGHSAEHNGHLY